jgi:hypothetical protein
MKWHLLPLALDEEREHLLRAACLEVERLLVLGQAREACLGLHEIAYALATVPTGGRRRRCGLASWRS